MVGNEDKRTAIYLAGVKDLEEFSYISAAMWAMVFLLLILALYKARDELFDKPGLGSLFLMASAMVGLRAIMILF